MNTRVASPVELSPGETKTFGFVFGNHVRIVHASFSPTHCTLEMVRRDRTPAHDLMGPNERRNFRMLSSVGETNFYFDETGDAAFNSENSVTLTFRNSTTAPARTPKVTFVFHVAIPDGVDAAVWRQCTDSLPPGCELAVYRHESQDGSESWSASAIDVSTIVEDDFERAANRCDERIRAPERTAKATTLAQALKALLIDPRTS